MTTPVRVALVFTACNRLGGVERVVREHARELAGRYDVTFVGERFDPAGIGDRVAFVEVPRAGRSPLPSSIRFRRAAGSVLERERFDVTVTFGANCPPGDVEVVQSVHRAWLASSAAIPTRWGEVPSRARYLMPQHLALLALERSYFRSSRVRRVLACSAATGDEVVAGYGVRRDLVGVMPNGFDPSEFNTEIRAADRTQMREQLGAENHIVLLFVANELHRKGFATLIDAVARTDDRRLHIHVVGRVEPGDYRARIAELGLAGRVHWHGPQADVARWYAAGDLFVLPTQYEPFGNVIVEALATGLPVITTRVAGAADAVRPGVNGFLQDRPTDAAELARLLVSACDDATLRSLQQRAAERLERFRWQAITPQLADAIDLAASRR
jgi:UDP-glucose:(heptosyl)LPS alpha-1,3-glucosyltransferase